VYFIKNLFQQSKKQRQILDDVDGVSLLRPAKPLIGTTFCLQSLLHCETRPTRSLSIATAIESSTFPQSVTDNYR